MAIETQKLNFDFEWVNILLLDASFFTTHSRFSMIKPQVLEVTCRNGHSLRCEPTKAKKTKRYICDGKRNGCHKNLTTGDKIYSCRACNYDLCSSCYETLLNEQFGTTPIKNNIKRQNKQNKKAFRKKKKKGNNNGKKRKGKNCNGTNHGNDNSENKCNSIDKFKSNDRSKAKYLLYNENARLTLTINDNKQEIILNTDQFLKDTIDSEQEEIFEVCVIHHALKHTSTYFEEVSYGAVFIFLDLSTLPLCSKFEKNNSSIEFNVLKSTNVKTVAY